MYTVRRERIFVLSTKMARHGQPDHRENEEEKISLRRFAQQKKTILDFMQKSHDRCRK